MVLMSIVFPRVLHLGRGAAGLTDLIAALLRGGRGDLPCDRPDETGELARNRGRLSRCSYETLTVKTGNDA